MTQQAPSNPLPAVLLRARDGLILHQTLYVVAKLGVADCLEEGWRSAAELARELKVNDDALYRVLRLLASQGVFEENDARRFRNNEISGFLRTGVPGSVRSLFIFWGSDFHYPSFGQIMHSIQTGESSRTYLSGTDGFEHLRRDPEQARIFDDAMTNMSELVGPAIAAAYDFGAWGSVMDVGGAATGFCCRRFSAHIQGCVVCWRIRSTCLNERASEDTWVAICRRAHRWSRVIFLRVFRGAAGHI
jgi:hypothetical protein